MCVTESTDAPLTALMVCSHDPLPGRGLGPAPAAEDVQGQLGQPVRDRGGVFEQEAQGGGGG